MGLRFPLCPELVDVLNFYGVLLAQVIPNSIGTAMSFICYLRERRMPWSIDLFDYFLTFRLDGRGVVTFVASHPDFKTGGLGNKMPNWWLYYCWAQPVPVPEIPDSPRRRARSRAKEPPAGAENIRGVEVDVRRYLQDPILFCRLMRLPSVEGVAAVAGPPQEVLRRPHPGRGGPLPSGPAGPSSSRAIPFAAGAAPRAVSGAGSRSRVSSTPSPSQLRSASSSGESTPSVTEISPPGPPPVAVGGTSDEAGAERRVPAPLLLGPVAEGPGPSDEHRRCDKGKAPQEEVPSSPEASVPKVFSSEDGHMAYVRLSEEWFPPGGCRPGPALSLGSVLHSVEFERRVEGLTWAELREESAAHHASAWRFCEHLAGVAEDRGDRERVLREQAQRWQEELSTAKTASALVVADLRGKVQELSQASLDQQELAARQMARMEDKCRRLREDLDVSIARESRSLRAGVSFCLSRLSKVGEVSPHWNDADRIFDLVSPSPDESSGEGSTGGMGAGDDDAAASGTGEQ